MISQGRGLITVAKPLRNLRPQIHRIGVHRKCRFKTGADTTQARSGPWRAVRPPAQLTPHRRREAVARRGAGETLSDIARTYNVSHSTISCL
jgi:hypothetical protein